MKNMPFNNSQVLKKDSVPLRLRGENKKTSRYITIEVLSEWQQSKEPVDSVMETVLQGFSLDDSRDNQLVMALVYGVIRWRGYLDGILAEFSKHPLDKMKVRTLQALRIGLYQMLFMDRIPDSAAINETVQALKSAGQPKWITGFVNGVLRTIAKNKNNLPDPWSEQAMLQSHPHWLIKRWRQRYGQQKTVEICRADNTEASVCLRVNTRAIPVADFLDQLKASGIKAEAGNFAPEGVRLIDYKGSVINLPGFQEGFFQVQDEAAQLATLLMGTLAAGAYLDGCAGLGGKTSHLAQMLPEGSHLVAVEPNIHRQKLLQGNLERLKFPADVEIYKGSLEDFKKEKKEFFKGILIDAPCSGLGVIRRHPDIRWNRSKDDLPRYHRKQLSLLNTAAGMLEPGGVLVYVACSIEPEENDEVIEQFLGNHQDFIVEDGKKILPQKAADLVDAKGFFRTTPDKRGLDGFFAARLKKKLTRRR